jgi:hypothetical protein
VHERTEEARQLVPIRKTMQRAYVLIEYMAAASCDTHYLKTEISTMGSPNSILKVTIIDSILAQGFGDQKSSLPTKHLNLIVQRRGVAC